MFSQKGETYMSTFVKQLILKLCLNFPAWACDLMAAQLIFRLFLYDQLQYIVANPIKEKKIDIQANLKINLVTCFP